jgi:hypothetical protein
MAAQIVEFQSADGKRYRTQAEAEEHDLYLEAMKLAKKGEGWGSYSPGYDGPMPVSKEVPTAEWLFSRRRFVRNIMLDLPEPDPVIVTKFDTRIVYRWPTGLLSVGFIGGIAAPYVFRFFFG